MVKMVVKGYKEKRLAEKLSGRWNLTQTSVM